MTKIMQKQRCLSLQVGGIGIDQVNKIQLWTFGDANWGVLMIYLIPENTDGETKTSARLLWMNECELSSLYLQLETTGRRLTFELWSELFHLGRQGFIEALLSYDQRLTHSVVIIAHHTRVTPHLQAEWTHEKKNTGKKKIHVLKKVNRPGEWRAPVERLLLVLEVQLLPLTLAPVTCCPCYWCEGGTWLRAEGLGHLLLKKARCTSALLSMFT